MRHMPVWYVLHDTSNNNFTLTPATTHYRDLLINQYVVPKEQDNCRFYKAGGDKTKYFTLPTSIFMGASQFSLAYNTDEEIGRFEFHYIHILLSVPGSGIRDLDDCSGLPRRSGYGPFKYIN